MEGMEHDIYNERGSVSRFNGKPEMVRLEDEPIERNSPAMGAISTVQTWPAYAWQ
jgi:hypothetical protein